ncbi:MAG TPA: ATP-dependent sacrificial sulfur transferase LarE [Gemmatimonadaceae bacterium]|nr:ATP-dependent sacrificial sulfur transferase LarE [Gemmatimonadaceae bacterium]
MTELRETSATSLAEEKERALIAWLRDRGSVLLGFSGGVDSAYLACVATEALGPDRVLAVIGRSASYPEEQWRTARDVAARFGLTVAEIDTDEMTDPRYVANPSNRCYFCKTELWSKLAPLARDRGLATIIDGTNADDIGGHRPGMQAAREQGVRSPLVEVGMTKRDVRERSRARGLPTWSQPSAPCLSSRLQYGLSVTAERLREVERAERALRDLGISGDLRVRHHGDLARVELSPEMLALWLSPIPMRMITAAIRAAGFARVAIDLRGFRSGSLNILNEVTAA